MATHHHRSGRHWSTIPSLVVLTVGLLGAVPLAGTGPAQVTFPAAPGPGQIVVDEASLIVPLHQVDIEGLAEPGVSRAGGSAVVVHAGDDRGPRRARRRRRLARSKRTKRARMGRRRVLWRDPALASDRFGQGR